MATITQEDLLTFEKEGNKWLNFFNLSDWLVEFKLDEEFEDDSLAITSACLSQKYAAIRVNTEWPDEEYYEESIKLVAFHEVCEVLLIELRILANERNTRDTDVDRACHTIIQRLTNRIYKQQMDK